MSDTFDYSEAKKNLLKKEQEKNEALEVERKKVLNHVMDILRELFKDKNVEVFLIGSIIIPYKFTEDSDVDIVLKNFKGDRFDIWPELERKIKRTVEVILYEKCSFQDHVNENGLKVM